MSSWDLIPKSGIYAKDSQRLCLFCFYVYKIDFQTEILFALDLSSLLIVRANNLAIFRGLFHFSLAIQKFLAMLTFRKCYICSEAVIRRYSSKQMFLKILQVSQENACLFNEVTGQQGYNIIEKVPQQQRFPAKFAKFLRISFLKSTSGGCFFYLLFISVAINISFNFFAAFQIWC